VEVRAPLVVSEPATIASPPSVATLPREGRSSSGSASPLYWKPHLETRMKDEIGHEHAPGDRTSLSY
jgi:hypothetical protein